MTGFVFLSVLTLGLVAAEIQRVLGRLDRVFPAFEGDSHSVQRLQQPAIMSNSRLKSGVQGSLDNGGQDR